MGCVLKKLLNLILSLLMNSSNLQTTNERESSNEETDLLSTILTKKNKVCLFQRNMHLKGLV